MSEQNEILSQLIELGKVDANVARIKAEQKQMADKLAEKNTVLEQSKAQTEKAFLAVHETKSLYERESSFIKTEQEKLVERRKALAASGDYKMQMAAEREIEHASKQLGTHEERLIEVMDKVETLQAEYDTVKASLDEVQKEYDELEKECNETQPNLETRLSEYSKKRGKLAKDIGRKDLQIYNRVFARYPMDPVVALTANTCRGCFMDLGPQAAVLISRGLELIRCRGCGRILYNTPVDEEE